MQLLAYLNRVIYGDRTKFSFPYNSPINFSTVDFFLKKVYNIVVFCQKR